MKGGSLQFVFPPVKRLAVSGLSAAQRVRQRRLKHRQQQRLGIIPSCTN